MSLSKNILLICLRFPPSPGIGGRRWAKFAKELATRGYKIHVIAALETNGESSFWTEDVQHPGIQVYDVPNPYPRLRSSSSLLEKVKNRWVLQQLLWDTKGTPFDEGIYWRTGMLKKAKELIQQHNISQVIATGAPFSTLYNSVELKERFPHIQLIVDYRDPWLRAVNYGMQDLSPKRKAFEYTQEQRVLRNADLIIAPTHPDVLIGTEAIAHAQAHFKVLEIPHSFDPQDMRNLIASEHNEEDHIKMIFGGSLYMGVDRQLVKLRDWTREIRATDPVLYQRLKIDIYSRDYARGRALLEADDQAMSFHAPVPQHQIFKAMIEADIALLFLADHNKDYKTTKFFEILALRRPFLLFGPEGMVAQYIKEKQLGVYVPAHEKDVEKFIQIIQRLKQEKTRFQSMDIDDFSLSKVTDQLIHYFS
ncbi:MAG: glycosyltransferase [Bacteroidota bacterium]